MQSDFHELCRNASTTLVVPAFPRESIRARIAHPPAKISRKSVFLSLIAASIPLAAVAAAAIVTQSHIRFVNGGGMVLKSQNLSYHFNASGNDVSRAAKQMHFHVIYPAGLPIGSKPIRLFVGDHDIMAITYDLPGAFRASHHLAWIFLADPNVASTKLPTNQYEVRTGNHMASAHWRAGDELVIVVSNGLTPKEISNIKSAMGGH